MGRRRNKNRFQVAGANALKAAPFQTAALTVSPSSGGESSAAADFDPSVDSEAGLQLIAAFREFRQQEKH
jgi:hypothetical protein